MPADASRACRAGEETIVKRARRAGGRCGVLPRGGRRMLDLQPLVDRFVEDVLRAVRGASLDELRAPGPGHARAGALRPPAAVPRAAPARRQARPQRPVRVAATSAPRKAAPVALAPEPAVANRRVRGDHRPRAPSRGDRCLPGAPRRRWRLRRPTRKGSRRPALSGPPAAHSAATCGREPRPGNGRGRRHSTREEGLSPQHSCASRDSRIIANPPCDSRFWGVTLIRES